MTGSRWSGVAALLLADLLPLWLVLTDRLAVADLLLAYLLEALLVVVVWAVGRQRSSHTLGDTWRAVGRRPGHHDWRAKGGLVVVVLAAVGTTGAAARAVLEAITWDAASLAATVASVVSLAVGLWLQQRHRERVRGGAVVWRLALLWLGALIGMGTARDLTALLARGWEPATLGEAWAAPFGVAFLDGATALGVAPAVLPALFVVLARTVHEVLYECYDVVRDAELADSSVSPRL